MEHQTGKIGIREYVAIVTLVIGTKIADDTPEILYDQVGNAAWISIIIIGLLAIIPLFFLLKVLAYHPNKSLMDISQIYFGRIISFFIILLLWIMGTLALIIDSAIYTDIIGTMYFTRTPTIIIYSILIGISAYGAKKGLEQVGSVAYAVLPYIKLTLLIALMLTFFHGEFDFIFPILGPGVWEIAKESTLKLSILGDFLYIGALAAFVKSSGEFKRGTWISLIILLIEFPVAVIGYLILFDYESVQLLNYPFHETIRYVSVGFLSNLETFFLPFWLISSFVRFAIYIYLSAIIFGWLFKIKNFEYVIPSLATLIVLIGIIPETPTFTLLSLRKILLNVFTPFFFMLPIFLWMMAKLKGDLKNAKNL
jgi:spore germination protein KB